MKNRMRLLGLVFILIIIQFSVFGQTDRKLQFWGYSLIQYKHPIQKPDGKYDAYFENLGQSQEQGRIIIDETSKTFKVKWLNGNEWTCRYTNSETRNEKEKWLGDVSKTIYTGKWEDTTFDAILIITHTESHGCITTVKSRKVVDKDYGIDTWQKTFNFTTGGECFENN